MTTTVWADVYDPETGITYEAVPIVSQVEFTVTS